MGQAALEKRPIQMETPLSNENHKVTGIIRGNTQYLHIVPLVNENELFGVIEFIFFDKPNTSKIEFINDSSQKIAMYLYNAQRRKIKEVLEITKKN